MACGICRGQDRPMVKIFMFFVRKNKNKNKNKTLLQVLCRLQLAKHMADALYSFICETSLIVVWLESDIIV